MSLNGTNCMAPQDSILWGQPILLAPGYYRAVLDGTTAIGRATGGTSEIAINVWSSDGFGLTEAWKTVSANGVSERSLGYFHLSVADQLLVLARVSINCGNASLSGKIGFERVGD